LPGSFTKLENLIFNQRAAAQHISGHTTQQNPCFFLPPHPKRIKNIIHSARVDQLEYLILNHLPLLNDRVDQLEYLIGGIALAPSAKPETNSKPLDVFFFASA
jgi:hypothetical protein